MDKVSKKLPKCSESLNVIALLVQAKCEYCPLGLQAEHLKKISSPTKLPFGAPTMRDA